MIDKSETYDPTKPLLIEGPLDYLYYTSLFFDRDKNITNYFTFYDGDPVEEKDYQLNFEIDMRESKLLELDIVPSTFPGIIANKKVVDILKGVCPDDFQVFPVTIKSNPGKRKSKAFINYDYFLIHITKKIESIDLEFSEFSLLDASKSKVPGNITGLKKLRFKSNCMQGSHLARDSILESVMFISQDLLRIFLQAGITGAAFVPDFLCHYERSNYPELFKKKEDN